MNIFQLNQQVLVCVQPSLMIVLIGSEFSVKPYPYFQQLYQVSSGGSRLAGQIISSRILDYLISTVQFHFSIIIFILTSVFHTCMGWTVSYEKLPSISVFSYVLSSFPFFQITSDYLIPCFVGRPLGKLPPTLKVLHLLDQALSSIFFCDDQTLQSSIL